MPPVRGDREEARCEAYHNQRRGAPSGGPGYTSAEDAAIWDACHLRRVDRIRDLAAAEQMTELEGVRAALEALREAAAGAVGDAFDAGDVEGEKPATLRTWKPLCGLLRAIPPARASFCYRLNPSPAP